MKTNTLLEHKSGVRFQYIGLEQRQFSNILVAKLLNLKSGKHEYFNVNTYKRFFKEV
jgi:hypothetical protein